MTMFLTRAFIAVIILAGTVTAPVYARASDQRRGDQMRAFEARREGRMLPLREIERRIVPIMAGAQYIGVNYDDEAGIYTLKFLRGGSVIWVDVDARSGHIIGRTGG